MCACCCYEDVDVHDTLLQFWNMLLLLFVQFNMMIDEHDAIPGCYDKPSCFSRTPIHIVCCCLVALWTLPRPCQLCVVGTAITMTSILITWSYARVYLVAN